MVRLRRLLAVMPVMGVLGAVPLVNISPGATELAVYPTQGTQTASPTTQISFRGDSTVPAPIIQVTGSSSGEHPGQVASHSDGNGFSFIPDTGFSPGETVTVKVPGHTLVGESNGEVTFQIFTPVKGIPNPNSDAGGKAKRYQKFRSEPGLQPPFLKVKYKKGGRAPGDIFTAPKISRGQDGAMITKDNGELVWFHRAPKGQSIYDFREQQFDGQPVLTWWQGKTLFAKGYGKGLIYDTSYHKIAQVTGGNGFQPDLHEFQLGPNGTAYTTSYQPVMADVSALSGHAGDKAAVFDCVVQGIDIQTGLVKFEWHSLDHISMANTYVKYIPNAAAPLDPWHVNSIDPESNGKLLISARNTNAVYDIDMASGAVDWTLGGKGTNFTMGQGSSFIAQHDARRRSDGDITIFDNGTGVPGVGGRPARGIRLHVDTDAHTATLVQKFKRSTPVSAPSQGNVENLANGNVFIGWGGSSPYMSEFKSDGTLIYDARFDPGGSKQGTDNNSYRSYRFTWSGHPYYPPKLALRSDKNHKVKVYASWNGATDVSYWEIIAGDSPDSLKKVKTVFHNAFESSTRIADKYRYVAVRAHAKNGDVLGTSAAVKR